MQEEQCCLALAMHSSAGQKTVSLEVLFSVPASPRKWGYASQHVSRPDEMQDLQASYIDQR